MIKVYCDRCKKIISGGEAIFYRRFSDPKDYAPEIGSYRGEVVGVQEQKLGKDFAEKHPDFPDYSYTPTMRLCHNCQKELDLMVTEYMGVKKR